MNRMPLAITTADPIAIAYDVGVWNRVRARTVPLALCLAAGLTAMRPGPAYNAENEDQPCPSAAGGANARDAAPVPTGWQRALQKPMPELAPPAIYNELRIRVSVEESVVFRIGRRQTECAFEGAAPRELRLNGVPWSPEPAAKLFNARATTHLPALVYMNDVSAEVVAGRGVVAFRQEGRGPEAQCLLRIDDLPDGSDQYEIVVRFGVTLPPPRLDPQTPDRLARMFAERPRTPLARQPGATSKAPAALPERYPYLYDTYGSHDVAWDDAARAFLSQAAVSRAVQFQPRMVNQLSLLDYPHNQDDLPGVLRAGLQVVEAGCDDPLVLQLYGRNLAASRDFDAAARALEKAGDRFSRVPYPKWCSCLLAVDLAIVRAGLRGNDSTPDEELMARAVADIAAAAEGPFAESELRHFRLELMRASQWPALRGYFGTVLAAIASRAMVDPWLVHLLTWRYQFDIAYDNLPDRALVLTVALPEPQEAQFQERLALARDHLLEAWRLHPERPEAAESLMVIAGNRGSVAGESRRFWFDRAVEGELGYLRVYASLLRSMKPSRGGDTDQMFAFARECLAVHRYDTDVPWFAVLALEDDEFSAEERVNLCRRPDVYGELEAMLAGYVRHRGSIDRVRDARMRQLALAVHSGKADVVRRLLGEIGDSLDDTVLDKYALTGDRIRSRFTAN